MGVDMAVVEMELVFLTARVVDAVSKTVPRDSVGVGIKCGSPLVKLAVSVNWSGGELHDINAATKSKGRALRRK